MSDGNYAEDYDREPRGSELESHKKELKSLHEKIAKLVLANQKHVHFVGEADETLEGLELSQEEANWVAGQNNYKPQGYSQGYNQNNNLSYRSTNVANPKDQVYPAQQAKPFVPYNKGFQPSGGFQGQGQNNFHGQQQGNKGYTPM